MKFATTIEVLKPKEIFSGADKALIKITCWGFIMANGDDTSSSDSSAKSNKWDEVNKKGGEAIIGFVVLCLIGYGVVSCVQIKREEASRTPQQVAADEARKRQRELDDKYKDLRGNAEEVLQNYLLSSGKGMCESLDNVTWKAVRYGTAVYEYAKREPSITGAYAADCIYYLNGERLVKKETYWFQVTMQTSSGQREGKILLENSAGIADNLRYTKFLDAM